MSESTNCLTSDMSAGGLVENAEPTLADVEVYRAVVDGLVKCDVTVIRRRRVVIRRKR